MLPLGSNGGQEEDRGRISRLESRVEELESENQKLRTENQKLKIQLPEKSGFKFNIQGPLTWLGLKRQKTEAENKKLNIEVITNTENKNKDKKMITNQPPKLNPFMNAEIIRVLLGFMNVRNLKRCRLVNTMWGEMAKKHFESRALLHIHSQKIGRIHKLMTMTANSFLNFRNVKLELDPGMRRLNWADTKGHLTPFFIEHGKYLRYLSLDFGYISSYRLGNTDFMDDFRDLFLASLEEIVELKLYSFPCDLFQQPRIFNPNNLRKSLPKLRVLDITPLRGLFCRNHSARTQVFSDLLSIAPNLEVLRWWPHRLRQVECDKTTHLIETLTEVNPQNLRTLSIHTKIDASAVDLLANSILKLHVLNLTEYESFDLKFSTFGESIISPKRVQFGKTSAGDLTCHLNQELAKLGEVSCTKLLQTFKSALTAKLNEG